MNISSLSKRLRNLRMEALSSSSQGIPAFFSPYHDFVPQGKFHLLGAAWKDYLSSMPVTFSVNDLLPSGFPAEYGSAFEKRHPELVSVLMNFKATHPGPKLGSLFWEGWVLGGGNHSIPGYAQIIQEGFPARLKRIEKRLNEEQDPNKQDFLLSMKEICQGLLSYFEHCADILEKATGLPENADRKEELQRLMESYRQVCKRPPANFREALIVYYTVYFFISDSPGCLDRYLDAFYRQDCEKGILDRQTAFEYICACFIRFYSASGGKDHQRSGACHMSVGGRNADGTSAVNELTTLCLDAFESLEMIRPQIAVRWFRDAPGEYLVRGMKLLQKNCGSPDFSNDEVFIPALEKRGIVPEDAAAYSPSGCNEVMIPGKSQMGALQGHFNLPKLLNILFRQTPPMPGMKLRPLSELSTYEDFRNEVRNLRRELFRQIHEFAIKQDRWRASTSMLLTLSLFTDDCIERGQSVANGGARYNGCNYDANGIINLADSMLIVRRLVYEEKRFSLETFAEILQKNWHGYETLQSEIRGKIVHFGNGEAESDTSAAEVFSETAADFSEGVPYRGGCWNMGTLGGYENAHVTLAEKTAATPDGRSDGEAFASGLSPSAGFDRNGPTAMLNSILHIPVSDICTSTIVNLMLSPTLFESDAGLRKAAQLIETYLKGGGIQIQITVADRELLLKAEKNPEQYKNLVVRVSGYSALFFSLNRFVREEIIRRTAHQLSE